MKEFVPDAKRRASRLLFEQFRKALQDKPARYPDYALGDATDLPDLGSIGSYADLVPGDLRLHLLDCRSFRQTPGPDSSLLGKAQRDLIDQQRLWLAPPGVNVVVSSVTLKDEWKDFGTDLRWLQNSARTSNIVVLSGDIHEPMFDDRFGLLEATASPLAQPATEAFDKSNQVFGVLDVFADRLEIALWAKGAVYDRPHVVRRTLPWPTRW